MGLNFSFFKTPTHRVFNYQPRHYDPRKEKMQERYDEAAKAKADEEGREWTNERYFPGRNIRGKIRDSKKRKHAMDAKTRRIVGGISLLLLFVVLYYFAQYAGWFAYLLF